MHGSRRYSWTGFISVVSLFTSIAIALVHEINGTEQEFLTRRGTDSHSE
jgi:hypothetical protein